MQIRDTFKGWVLITVILLIIAEIVWSWANNKKAYTFKETFTNIAILIGFNLSKFIFAGYQLLLLTWSAKYTLFSLKESWLTFLICFILADFIYYWFHRLSHIWKIMWAFHVVHHSSPLMNLTTAYRLNWLSAIISPLFFLPLAFIGFPPDYIVLSYALNLLYQFFLHTEAVGKLGKLEGIIDTPSAHRVHHGSNKGYVDKNFGGVLMIWDRIFHTYQPETEKVKYGITTGFKSNNPFVLVFHGFVDLFKKRMKYKG